MANREEYFLEYARTHKEHRKKYRENNKDKIKEYYQNNRNKILKDQREWKRKNKDQVDEYNKNYRKNNRGRIKEKNKKYFQIHPEVQLKSKIKQLKKCAIPFRLPHKEYWYALICWAKQVKKRDKACVICGSKDKLDAHHIIYKKYNPELSLNVNNGITLCRKHHNEAHGKDIRN